MKKIILALVIGTASNALAYFSTLDTGELLKPDVHNVYLEPQFVLSGKEGFNLVGHFETFVSENSTVRAQLGFGTVNFETGLFWKWIPIPDTDDQPALGLKLGATYAKVSDDNQLSLRLHPLISKKFETQMGDVTPYASLPIGVTSHSDDDSTVPVNLTLGTSFKALSLPDFQFWTELGINVSESFSYISLGISYNLAEAQLQ